MGRKARPCYHKRLGRWYAQDWRTGAGRVVACRLCSAVGAGRSRGVGDDRGGTGAAWAEVEPLDPANMTVEQVAQHYLFWAEKRRDAGKLSPIHYESNARHLRHFADGAGIARGPDAVGGGGGRVPRGPRGLCRRLPRKNIMNSIDACLNWAARAGHLPCNPIRGHDPIRVPRSATRFAPPAETAALLRFWLHRRPRGTPRSRYDRQALLLIRCLVRTGARPKELCRLRWDQIRWEGTQLGRRALVRDGHPGGAQDRRGHRQARDDLFPARAPWRPPAGVQGPAASRVRLHPRHGAGRQGGR